MPVLQFPSTLPPYSFRKIIWMPKYYWVLRILGIHQNKRGLKWVLTISINGNRKIGALMRNAAFFSQVLPRDLEAYLQVQKMAQMSHYNRCWFLEDLYWCWRVWWRKLMNNFEGDLSLRRGVYLILYMNIVSYLSLIFLCSSVFI